MIDLYTVFLTLRGQTVHFVRSQEYCISMQPSTSTAWPQHKFTQPLIYVQSQGYFTLVRTLSAAQCWAKFLEFVRDPPVRSAVALRACVPVVCLENGLFATYIARYGLCLARSRNCQG